MPFNVALTGIRAASVDLEVTGNNIANASTTGFKQSRVEFADLYANSYLGIGSNPIGDGVRVQDVSQEFSQGNINFTDNGLDLAINGNGFFVVDDTSGGRRYTRAGAFGIDKEGYMVNSSEMRLQGFAASDEGVIGGVLDDLLIDTTALPPERTTEVLADINLDAEEPILVDRGIALASDGNLIGQVQVFDTNIAGTGFVNGYTGQGIDIVFPDGNTETVTFDTNASAREIVDTLSEVDGVEGSATTEVKIRNFTAVAPPESAPTITVNGIAFDNVRTASDLGNAINQSPLLRGISAVIAGPGELLISSSVGDDLTFELTPPPGPAPSTPTSFDVVGMKPADSVGTLQEASQATLFSNTTSNAATVGGYLSLSLDEGISVTPASTDIIDTTQGTPFENNAFDPKDEASYNHATSTTIYDSLGNPHVATMFFVKEATSGSLESSFWTVYLQIDGRDVGDPLEPDGEPTRASYGLVFNEDGSINKALSEDLLVSNWTPVDETGTPNGADGPVPKIEGGELPIELPPDSSNFFIDIGMMTQYGGEFAVNDLQQNGYTTGRLVGLDIDDGGSIFARYTNGESQVLGRVALANFNDVNGLSPIGDTTWVETFASGNPVIGPPGTAALGTIRASSLEDSNVELSEELVNLIIAQRNYQANAKTIETANTVTQTIINLR